MSTKEALIQWNDGVLSMEKKDYSKAIEIFDNAVEISAKILFNTALCNVILNRLDIALQKMEVAMKKDDHLALGFHFRGILNFKLRKYENAVKDFEAAHTKLRGKNVIDYNQLGCRYKFYAFEALYNCGVSWSRLNARPKALDYLLQAQKCKVDKKHEVIDKTITRVDVNETVDIIDLPVDCIWRPPKSKLVNLQKKDYLGKAKVISAVDTTDVTPGFEAPRKITLAVPGQGISQSRSAPSSPASSRKLPLLPKKPKDKNALSVEPLAASLTHARSANDLLEKEKNSKGSDRTVIPPPPTKTPPQPKSKGSGKALPIPPSSAGSASPKPDKPLILPPRSPGPGQNVTAARSKPLPPPPEINVTKTNDDSQLSMVQRMQKELKSKSNPGVTQPPSPNRSFNSSSTDDIPPPRPAKQSSVQSTSLVTSDDVPPPRPAKNISQTSRPAPPSLPSEDTPPQRAPLPPKPKLPSKNPKNDVTVELTCNDVIQVQVAKGTSLARLLEIAYDKFQLEPGTIDLWYPTGTGEDYDPIEHEDEMTRVWAAVTSKLRLSCFSKQ